MVFGQEEKLVFFRFDDGEDFLETFKIELQKRELSSLVIIGGIGMLKDFQVGWFNTPLKEYEKEHVSVPHELLSLSGSVSLKGESVYVHLHAALSGPSRSAVGGHLFSGTVCNTLELFALKTGNLKLTRDPSRTISSLDCDG